MPESHLLPVSDEMLFEAFDKLAERMGVHPPNSPGQQRAVALIVGAFFAGARFFQHVQETHESSLPEFALPGIDFDPKVVAATLAKRRGPRR